MNIIIDLNRDTDAVALSDAEAAGEDHIVFQMMFCNPRLQKLYDVLRTFEMAGAAYTNLYNQHIITPLQGRLH
jgi:hypothetical protein